MKCACCKSSAALLGPRTWHQPKIYTCLEMSLCPLVSIAVSLGRHLERRGQLKHSFSRALGEERVQEVRDMCYFPTGATLRMCQSHVSGNDSEKKDGRRGRSGRQRPDFTQKARDQWIGRLCTLRTALSLRVHTHKAAVWWKDWPICSPSEKLEEDIRTNTRIDGGKHTQKQHPGLLYLAAGTTRVRLSSRPPQACHVDEWIWVTVN